jgi:hypothetical protein
MPMGLVRALREIALCTVPARWRASVRQDLDEETQSDNRLTAVASVWQALAIGVRLRRRDAGRVGATSARARLAVLRGTFADVRFAARMFRRQPGVVAVTVAGVSLAIGVSTAVFSLVNALSFRGYGIVDAGSVYGVDLFQGKTAATGDGSRRHRDHLGVRGRRPWTAERSPWSRPRDPAGHLVDQRQRQLLPGARRSALTRARVRRIGRRARRDAGHRLLVRVVDADVRF